MAFTSGIRPICDWKWIIWSFSCSSPKFVISRGSRKPFQHAFQHVCSSMFWVALETASLWAGYSALELAPLLSPSVIPQPHLINIVAFLSLFPNVLLMYSGRNVKKRRFDPTQQGPIWVSHTGGRPPCTVGFWVWWVFSRAAGTLKSGNKTIGW